MATVVVEYYRILRIPDTLNIPRSCRRRGLGKRRSDIPAVIGREDYVPVRSSTNLVSHYFTRAEVNTWMANKPQYLQYHIS